VIGIISVSLLGMGLLLLSKMHQDIASFATMTVIQAIHALNVFYYSTREVRLMPFLDLRFGHQPFLLYLVDQSDEHGAEQNMDREISTTNAVPGFRHYLLPNHLAIEDALNE
jgi:hypothetical protein